MTVVLRKNFYTIIPFSFNALNATFAGIPSIKLPPSGKKVSLATRVSVRTEESHPLFALVFTIRIFLG